MITDLTVSARELQQRAERTGGRGVGGRTDDDLDAKRLRARADDVARLREDVIGDEEARALLLAHALAQRHRLGGSGRLVQHRRVGDRHSGEIAHHRLEIDERLEAPLRDLRLVRRIGGVPRRVLEDVAQDDAGRVRSVVALADEGAQHAILRGDRRELLERLVLAHRRGQREGRGTADRRRNERVDQRGPRSGSQALRALPPDRRAWCRCAAR